MEFDYTAPGDIAQFVEYACNAGYRREVREWLDRWEREHAEEISRNLTA